MMRWFLVLSAWFVCPVCSLAQEFDRLDGPLLAGLVNRPEVAAHDVLTLADMAALPVVFKETRAIALVVRTDQGNLARVLVAPGLRTRPGGEGEPVPTFVLERFETFVMPGARDRLARGRDVTLFPGFQMDLDSGQVVPEGLGGDLKMVEGGTEGPRLTVVGNARVFTFQSSPLPRATGARPSAGRQVVPADFSGRYRLFANGQWSGLLELTVTDGDVVGRFRSDQTGTSYPVAGQTGSPAHRVRFTVTLPRTRLEYDGHLFTDGKGGIAGTVTLLERPFGFFAVREGGTLNPEGDEADVVGAASDRGKIVLEHAGDGFRLDGKDMNAEGLAQALRDAVQDDPARWVLLRVGPTERFEAVRQTIECVREAGIDVVRLEVLKEGQK